jgi:hypothetical protein
MRLSHPRWQKPKVRHQPLHDTRIFKAVARGKHRLLHFILRLSPFFVARRNMEESLFVAEHIQLFSTIFISSSVKPYNS